MEVETHDNYIGGRWIPSAGGSTYTITNPASKRLALGEFQSLTEADARDARRPTTPWRSRCGADDVPEQPGAHRVPRRP